MGQPVFKTVVPAGPVTEGEAFTIQYIWEDQELISNFRVESFNGLKMVNGPVSYKAAVPTPTGSSQLQNFVYTVVAPSVGLFNAPQALAVYKGKQIRSSTAIIRVISAKQAEANLQKQKPAEGYLLKTGEDPYKKINEDLFVRMLVDKTTCYVGQPIVATYKLYSRLESRSDIIRNPGFYGFAVHDMITLSDQVKTTEWVDGKEFDVHILRQAQLYPLQSGELTIDGMEIKNRVRFSRESKKEQEVAEGLLNSEEDGPKANDEYETVMNSAPLTVRVKALTDKNRPDSFTGAVGKFSIQARVLKASLARNEAGILELEISGAGNFIQLTPLPIAWPDNIEGFEARLSDSLNKRSVPLAGKRWFRYSFVSSRSGKYVIPSISFSYFEPDSGKYLSMKTRPVSFTILEKDLVAKTPVVNVSTISRKQYWWLLLLLIPLLLLVARNKQKKLPIHSDQTIGRRRSAQELFEPGKTLLSTPGDACFVFIREKLLFMLVQEFNYEASGFNKEGLKILLTAAGVKTELIEELLKVIADCEMVIYTGVYPSQPVELIFRKAMEIAGKLERDHSAYL